MKTAFAQITCMVFMDKTKSKVYCFLQSKCSVYFNKIMKSKHMLWEYRIIFVSKFLQICMKFDRPGSLLTSLTIHNKPVILAILICEKYLMSNCLFFRQK